MPQDSASTAFIRFFPEGQRSAAPSTPTPTLSVDSRQDNFSPIQETFFMPAIKVSFFIISTMNQCQYIVSDQLVVFFLWTWNITIKQLIVLIIEGNSSLFSFNAWEIVWNKIFSVFRGNLNKNIEYKRFWSLFKILWQTWFLFYFSFNFQHGMNHCLDFQFSILKIT